MKIKTSNLDQLPLDYVMTSIFNPDGLKYGVEDWREQRRRVTNDRGEFLHRYHQNWNFIGPTLKVRGILVGESPFAGAECAAGVGNEWDTCQHIMTGPSYEVAICRTIVASEKGQEVDVPVELLTIQDLETQYVEGAAEYQSTMAALDNGAQELHDFLAVRDALREHPEFKGSLPQTYFSGGDLDPDGQEVMLPHATQRG